MLIKQRNYFEPTLSIESSDKHESKVAKKKVAPYGK